MPERAEKAVIAGRFELLDEVGTGGMGTVHRARQMSLDREVALKVLHSKIAFSARARRRFGREARAVARLNHPHIASVFDFGTDDDGQTLWLAMELVDGSSMKQLKRDRVDTVQLLSLIDQVLSALSAAHARGIIHRDLKPTNILSATDERGRRVIKLVDFGLAASQHGDLDLNDAPGGIGNEKSESAEALLGTPRYMAPELLLRDQVDPRVDLYALGVILFEILTGEPPYDGSEPSEVIRGHIETPIPAVEPRDGVSLPPDLEGLIHRLLAKEPTDRYQTAAQVREDVRAILSDLSFAPWVVLGPTLDASASDFGVGADRGISGGGQSGGAQSSHAGQTRPPSQIHQEGLEERMSKARQVVPLVGRHAERRVLQNQVSHALRNEEGRMAFLLGEAGIGKSRLVEWLQVRVREGGLMTVTEGTFSERSGSLYGVSSALKSLLGIEDVRPGRFNELLERQLERYGLSPDERTVIGRLLSPSRSDEITEQINTEDLNDPSPVGEELFGAVEHVLRSGARGKPLMLVLENLHESGPTTAAFLEHLSVGLKLNPAPIFVIGTARTEALDETPAVRDALEEIARISSDSVKRLELSRLDRNEALSLIEHLAPTEDEFADVLTERSGGNPRLLIQLFRYLRESGKLESDGRFWRLKDGVDLDAEIPAEVADLVRYRIERLGGGSQDEGVDEVLRRAAVLGERFDYLLLRRMVERTADEALIDHFDSVLERLVSEGILREVGRSGQDLLEFDHRIMRDVLLREMDRDEEWKAFHRAAAEAKEAGSGEQQEDFTLEIVEHYREAEDLVGLARQTVRAAQSATQSSDLERAIDLYGEAREALRKMEESEDHGSPVTLGLPCHLEVGLEIGHLHRRMNQYDRAREAYRSVLGADEPRTVAWARWGLGKIAEAQGALDEAQGWYEAASRAGRQARTSGGGDGPEQTAAVEGACLFGLGTVARLQGRFETASTLLSDALSRAESVGRLQLQVNTLRALSEVNWRLGDVSLSHSFRSQAMALAEDSGERRLVAENRMHAAMLFGESGQPERGREEAEAAIALFEEQNERHKVAQAMRVLGEIQWRCGRYEEAANVLQRSLKLYRIFSDRRGVTHCQFQLARIALSLGKTDRVKVLGRKAMEGYREMEDKRGLIRSGLLFGRLARQLGRMSDAADAFGRAASGLDRLGDVRGRICAQALQALVLEEMEDHDSAEGLLNTLLREPLIEEMAEESLAGAFDKLTDLIAPRDPDIAEHLQRIAVGTRRRLGRLRPESAPSLDEKTHVE